MSNEKKGFLSRFFGGKNANPLEQKWAQNRLAHAALIKENDRVRKLANATQTREIYAAIDGSVYYEHASTGQIPHERLRKFKRLLTKSLFDLSPAPINNAVDAIQSAIDKGDAAAGLQALKAIRGRLLADPKELALIELGAICVIRHDEDPHGYNHQIHVEKVVAAQQDANLRFFFAYIASVALLSEGKAIGALDKLKSWGLTSEDTIHEFLEAVMK